MDEEEDTGLQPGMYYKFRTRSSSPASLGVDPATNELVTVYHLERFVPVFSHYMFASKGIDAKRIMSISIRLPFGQVMQDSMFPMQV